MEARISQSCYKPLQSLPPTCLSLHRDPHDPLWCLLECALLTALRHLLLCLQGSQKMRHGGLVPRFQEPREILPDHWLPNLELGSHTQLLFPSR